MAVWVNLKIADLGVLWLKNDKIGGFVGPSIVKYIHFCFARFLLFSSRTIYLGDIKKNYRIFYLKLSQGKETLPQIQTFFLVKMCSTRFFSSFIKLRAKNCTQYNISKNLGMYLESTISNISVLILDGNNDVATNFYVQNLA